MKIIKDTKASCELWVEEIGFSRDQIIDKILDGDWLKHQSSDPVLIAKEIWGNPYAIGFDCFTDDHAASEACASKLYREEERFNAYRPANTTSFDVIFFYAGFKENIRLRSVFFYGNRYKGMGKEFLKSIMIIALEIGATKIFVEPGLEGSSYWTSRGAIIRTNDIFDEMSYLIKDINDRTCRLQGWSEVDIHNINQVFNEHDIMGLHKFIDRDDLFLDGERFRRKLLNDQEPGPCIFDLDHPWTQYSLKKRVGFDVVAEQAQLENSPHRATKMIPQFKTSGPAF